MVKCDRAITLWEDAFSPSGAAPRYEVEESGGRRTPPVKPRIAEATPRAYRKTRIEAANETGLKENEFPRGVSIQLERYRQPRICALRNLAVAFRQALPLHSEMTAQHHSVD